MATTENLTPDAESLNGFTPVVALTNLEAAQCDDDTKYNKSSVDTTRDLFGMRPVSALAHWITGGNPPSGVQVSYRARSSAGAPTFRGVIKLGATSVVGTNHTLNTTWTAYNTGDNLARPGAGSWHPQDINDLLAGYETVTCAGNEVWVSKVRLDVTWEIATVSSAPADLLVLSCDLAVDEPIRFTARVQLNNPDDIDLMDSNIYELLQMPFTLPGINKSLFLSISRSTLVNPAHP